MRGCKQEYQQMKGVGLKKVVEEGDYTKMNVFAAYGYDININPGSKKIILFIPYLNRTPVFTSIIGNNVVISISKQYHSAIRDNH